MADNHDTVKYQLLKQVLVGEKQVKRQEVADLLNFGSTTRGDDLLDQLMEFLKHQNLEYYTGIQSLSTRLLDAFVAGRMTFPGGPWSITTYSAFEKLVQTLKTPVPPEPTTVDGVDQENEQRYMTERLRSKISPSAQVSTTDEKKKVEARQEFFKNVTDVATIVEDAFLLHAVSLSKKKASYLTEEADKERVETLAARLAFRADGMYHKSVNNEEGVTVRARKAAKIDEMTLNADGSICEDARSSSFARAWNCNFLAGHNVQACPQFIAHSSEGSIKRSDVVFCKIEDANDDGFQDTVDYPSVVEWKNSMTEGADREGATYALYIQHGFGRKRFLVLSIAPGKAEVFGLYWKADTQTVSRVKLAAYDSITTCFKEWFEAILFFVNESECYKLTSPCPLFTIGAKNSEMLTDNVYKVTDSSDSQYVYKVYDYSNREFIPVSERRWLNWDLVKRFYPAGVESVLETQNCRIFRHPFQDGGSKFGQHVLPSIELFKSIGKKRKDLHTMGWIWGDVRFGNMLFISGAAHIIDVDFARRVEDKNAKYPPGYVTQGLPRHRDARESCSMKQEHDVDSFLQCFQILCNTAYDCPGKTMEEILEHIAMDGYEPPSPEKLPELTHTSRTKACSVSR